MSKILKKGLSVFLAAVMLISAAPLSGFVGLELPSWSSIISYAANEQKIKVNETKTVSVTGGSVTYLEFIPTENGTYIFYSTGSVDTYGYLYDSSKNQITYNDDGGEGRNFKISYALTAGTTYYWGIRFYNSSTSGNINVSLEKQCKHVYQKETTKEASCAEPGEAVYTCSICGNTYTEKIPRHIDNNNDKICDICGEDAREVLNSGSCGSNIDWFLYDDGELEIVGTGGLPSYNYTSNIFSFSYSHPWSSYSSQIKSIVISEGITSIGDYCFGKITSLENVLIPDTVTSIGTGAFFDCENLTEICISNKDTTIGQNAFGYYHTSGFASNRRTLKYENRSVYGVCDSAAHQYAKDNNINFYCYHGFSDRSVFSSETVSTQCGDILKTKCSVCGYEYLDMSGVEHDYVVNSVCDCIKGGIDTYVCSRCGDTYTKNFSARHADKDDDGYCDYCYEPFGGVLDLVFVIDVTGSMSSEIAVVKSSIQSYADMLSKSNIPHYISLIEYSNNCENGYYNVIFDFTDNDEKIQNEIAKFSMKDGANEPAYTAIIDGLNELHWGTNSAKRIILIGDEEPNGDLNKNTYDAAIETLNTENISVYSIATGGSDLTQFKNLSTNTNGQYYQSSNAEDFSSTLIDIIDSIPETIHLHDYIETVITAPTCTKTGVSSYLCSGCGKQLTNSVVPALGHDYESEHFEATAEKESYTVYTCKNCNDTYQVLDPAAPVESFVALGDVNCINLSWLKAVEASVTGYEIYRKPENEEQFTLLKKIDSRNILSYVDSNLYAGNEYSYKIRAMKDSVEGDFSQVVTAMPESDTAKPIIKNVSPANYSIKNCTFEIKASAEDNVGVELFKIDISSDNGTTWDSLYQKRSSTISYKLDTTKYSDGEYLIQLVAVDKVGNESDGYIINCAFDNSGPEKVSGVTASDIYSSKLTLKWNDVKDKDRAGYILQRKENGDYVTVNSKINTIGYNVSNLKPDTEYTFIVAAFDQLGNIGEYSDEYVVTTLSDTSVPVITKQAPSPARYSKSIPFNVTAKDDCEIASIRIETSRDTDTWEAVHSESFANKNTAYVSYNVDVSDMQEGKLQVRAIATDASGNVSDESNKAPYIEYYIDHTAPKAPDGIKVKENDGYIEISWNQGKESDLGTYSIYRAQSGGSEYSCIASSLSTLNYYDRSISRGVSYDYKICVCDTAGNDSDFSEVVNAIALTDTIKPEIKSISPSTGSSIGSNNNKISVLAADNNTLDKITVEYKTSALQKFTILKEFTNINNYYKTVYAELPIDTLSHGDKVYVRAVCTDTSSLSSEYSDTIQFTVDKKAPELTDMKGNLQEKTYTLSWSDCSEYDLAGFKIYRKDNNGAYKAVASRSVNSSHNYSVKQTLDEGFYVYKIDCIDTAGNIKSYYTEEISVEKNSKLNPVITSASYFEVGVQEVFSAKDSTSSNRITSYLWNFGDGTTSTSEAPTKSFAKAGMYTVSLTLTDVSGMTMTVSKDIIVHERALLGTAKVRITDENGKVLSGMPVYFDLGTDEQQIVHTNATGFASATLPVGGHIIGTYQNGYLPASQQINIRSGETTTITLTAEKRNIITGEFHVKEMTLDEIIAAGIDVSNPANQQIYNVSVTLIYGTQRIPVSYIRNESEIISFKIDDGDVGDYEITSISYIPNAANEEIIAVVAIPITASYLKQFFNAELTIFNNATSQFNIVDCEAAIDVPNGLTVVSGSNINDTIPGQSSSSANWILRGDKPGKYNLSASFSGVLENFNSPVSATFKADETVEVYGTDSVKLRVEVGDIKDGSLRFNVCLVNLRPVNLNCPNIHTGPFIYNITEAYKKGLTNEGMTEDDIKVVDSELIDCVVVDSSGKATVHEVESDAGTPISTLEPGGILKYEYMLRGLTDDIGEYVLQQSLINCAEDYYASSIEVVKIGDQKVIVSDEQYTKEHLQFAASPAYRTISDVNFADIMSDAVDHSFESFWMQNILEFDITDLDHSKYSETVLCDAIFDLCNVSYAQQNFNKIAATKYKTFIGDFAKLFDDDGALKELKLSKSKIEKILEGTNYESSDYKLFNSFMSSHMEDESIKAFYKTYNIAGNLADIYNLGVDCAKNIQNALKYVAALETCTEMTQSIKDGFSAMSEKLNESGSSVSIGTMNKYIATITDTTNFERDLKKRAIDCAKENLFDYAAFLYKSLLTDFTKKVAYDVMIKLGFAATASLETANLVVAGYSMGKALGKVLTNSGEISKQLGYLSASGDFAVAALEAMEDAKTELLNSKNYESAVKFDASFKIYKALQLNAFDAFRSYGNAKLDAIIVKFLEYIHATDKSDWRTTIQDITIMEQKYSSTYCHVPEHETSYSDSSKLITVSCPTTVYVYSKGGELLVKASNDEVINNTSYIVANSVENVKFIALPCSTEYDIVIEANDSGTMEYEIYEYENHTEKSRDVQFAEISLEAGDIYCGTINSEFDTDIENYNLIKNSVEVIKPDSDNKNCIKSFRLEQSDYNIGVNDSIKIEYVIEPVDVENNKVTFIIKDTSIAKISEDGILTGLKIGETMLEAITEDGHFYDVATINVSHCNHVFGDAKIVRESTCISKGMSIRICSLCGCEEEIELELAEHTYKEETINPTCTTEGYITHTCSVCGDSYTSDVVAKTDHSWNWIVDKEATCGVNGLKHQECTNCDAVQSQNTVILATGNHNYNEGTVIEKPSCTVEGKLVKTCSTCGHEVEKVLPKTEHIDNDDNGYCDECGIELAPHNPTTHCSCNCHKSGIVKFFWKIANFFHKIFKMEKYHYCDCGAAHW